MLFRKKNYKIAKYFRHIKIRDNPLKFKSKAASKVNKYFDSTRK